VAADKVCGIDRQDLVPVGSAKTEFLESDQIAKQFAARIAPAFQRAVKHDQRRSSGVACSMNYARRVRKVWAAHWPRRCGAPKACCCRWDANLLKGTPAPPATRRSQSRLCSVRHSRAGYSSPQTRTYVSAARPCVFLPSWLSCTSAAFSHNQDPFRSSPERGGCGATIPSPLRGGHHPICVEDNRRHFQKWAHN
jgi:hypothetical protein